MEVFHIEIRHRNSMRVFPYHASRRRATPPESEPEEPTDSSDVESSSEEPTDSSDVESDEPEEPEEPTDSSDVESSSEENRWELAAGGLSAAAAAAAEEIGASLEATDSNEAEQGSPNSSETESSVFSPSEDEWEDFSQADFLGSMEAAVDVAAAASAAEGAAGPCNGNARSQRLERRAAERCRQR
jgi:hypothetical protein